MVKLNQMVKLKGFTIIETLISMALFVITILLSNMIIDNIFHQPNRTDLIEINQCIKRISECKTTEEFQKKVALLDLKNIEFTYEIEYLEYNSICYFHLTKSSDSIFTHFIILNHED